MLKTGQYNRLQIARIVEIGAYLDTGDGMEVLLPKRYLTGCEAVGDLVDVFVYNDSEDRPVATTEHPQAMVGEFAFLKVKAVNRIGAFLDWGLMKDLLCPFSEQKSRMIEGGIYPVYIYLDHNTRRIVASAKLQKFLGNVLPDYERGQKVKALILNETEIGFTCVVDNLHRGMVYHNRTRRNLCPGKVIDAVVERVRDDGKIDLVEAGIGADRTHALAQRIKTAMGVSGGRIGIDDGSSPREIRNTFGCSKRDFKQAMGHLIKSGIVRKPTAGDRGYELLAR